MSTFDRLPRKLQTDLVRLCPGQRVRVPKRLRTPEVEILASVLAEMDRDGFSQWGACCRVAYRIGLHRETVWRIVSRRRLQARVSAPVIDPEYGHGTSRNRAV